MTTSSIGSNANASLQSILGTRQNERAETAALERSETTPDGDESGAKPAAAAAASKANLPAYVGNNLNTTA